MSNRLVRLAQRVTVLTIDGVDRPIRASEKAVLTTLADDARDASGECAALSLHEVARRASLARRTVDFAMAALIEARLIARDGRPGRRAAVTRLFLSPDSHLLRSGFASDANQVRITCESDSHPSLPVTQYDHMPSAGAREPVDEVDQVFAAWDAMAAAAKLPGCPIERDAAREAAILRHLRERRVGQIIAAIHHLGRSKWLTGKRADGQGDFMASFDWVFGVGNRGWARNLLRIIEGEFNRGERAPEELPATPTPSPQIDRGEPAEVDAWRTCAESLVGAGVARAYLDNLRLAFDGARLTVACPSAFVLDVLQGEHRRALDEAGRRSFGEHRFTGCSFVRQLARAGPAP